MRNKSRKAMKGIAGAMMAAMMLAGGTLVYAEDATGAVQETEATPLEQLEISIESEAGNLQEGRIIPFSLIVKNPTEEDFNELKLEAAIAVEGANWGDAVAYKGFEPCTLKAGEQRVFMGHFYLVADLGYGDGDPVKHGYIAAVATCDGKTSPQIKQEFPYIESDLWAKIVENYINNIRHTDWLNNGVAAHFFKDMASANDVAAVTTMECSDFNLEGPYYNEETRRIEIPYDVFAAEAEKLFVKVPDMTEVNLVNLIYYDDSINAMCRPIGGVGNPPHVVIKENVLELGDGRYAVQFKISNEMLGEGTDEDIPDMNDENNYTKCTLTVEENTNGGWRFVSFEDGYTEGTTKPIEPSEPSGPTDPQQPESSENRLPQETVNRVVTEISSASEGERVVVDMNSATIIPKEILQALKGKNANVVFEMEGYTWLINGKSITETGLKDINLEVKTNVNAIPSDIVDRLANGKTTKQITLTHEGAFGFEAELSLYIGSEYAGQYGNLFWHRNGKIQYMNSGLIDEDGFVTLNFDHASDYVVIMSKEKMSSENIPADLREGKVTVEKSPKTGDSSDIVLLYALLMIGAGTAVMGVKRKM